SSRTSCRSPTAWPRPAPLLPPTGRSARRPSPRSPPMPAPADGIQLSATSGVVSNASAVATLAGAVGRLTYISGFQIWALGATGASVASPTVAGIVGGTIVTFFSVVAGVALPCQPFPLDFKFPMPVPANGLNTAIVVTCPALGAGNTTTIVNAQGFQI